jgi:hypothetical protein
MTHPGSFRITSRNRAFESYLDPKVRGSRRVQRIVDSLAREICDADNHARARCVFERPRELYRLEIHSPAMGYERTTLLERDALDALLEDPAVRHRLRVERASTSSPGGETG